MSFLSHHHKAAHRVALLVEHRPIAADPSLAVGNAPFHAASRITPILMLGVTY